MQQTLRPYATTGVAIVGAAVIAVVPAAPQLLDGQRQLARIEAHAVRLAAESGDVFGPYVDLITNTLANLQNLGEHAFDFPILTQFFSDPSGSIANIPDALALLTNLMPTLDVSLLPLPAHLGVELPVWADNLLAGLGPLVTTGTAIGDVITQVLDVFSDPLGALSALVGAPATVLDALLNGTTGIDLMGSTLPLFNGLLVGGQPFDLTLNVGELVNAFGMGELTLTDLLGDFGTQTIPSLLTQLLDSMGIGDLTPVGLLDQLGIAQESLATLLIDLLSSTGMGDESIAELLDQFGMGGDTTVASLLIQLLDSSDIGNPTITGLLDEFGYGQMTLGNALIQLLDSMGIGTTAISSLVPADTTVGGLLTPMLGDTTITGLLGSMGEMTMPELITVMFGDYGQQTLTELITAGDLGPVSLDTPLMQLFTELLLPPGYTLGDLLEAGDPSIANMQLGPLIDTFPVPDMPGIGPYPPGTNMGEMRFTDLLTVAGVGNQHLSELDPSQADLAGKIGDPTLNQLLGNNDVDTTLQNLGLYDVTMGELIQSMGSGVWTLQISDLIDSLNITTTVGDFLTSLGFNPTLTDMVTGLLDGMGLGDVTLNQLLSDWGLDNVTASSVIDQLGFNDLYVVPILNALGFNNLDLDTVVDRLGLDVTINQLLTNIGLDQVHLDSVINSLFGDITMGPILNGLGLNDVTLNDVIESLLGEVNVGKLLTDLGLNTNDLNTVVTEFLDGIGWGDTTINSLLGDLGIAGLDVNTLLSNLGLDDLDIFNVTTSDFFGPIAEGLINLPQQIADALAGL